MASVNPLRYRGYYHDDETGFYYLGSRYYDPVIGRWINPEKNVYQGDFDDGAGLLGYNAYTYCANNPINYSDSTGEFIITAIVAGALGGAIIGGISNGIAAYKSAKSSGLHGADLFWKTAGGVGKGAVVGGVGGSLIGATGGVVAVYGISSVAGTAMITGTATIAAKATEVTALQVKKSASEGLSSAQIVNNSFDAVFGNAGKIAVFPFVMKGIATTGSYLYKDLFKQKVLPLKPSDFLRSKSNPAISYLLAGNAWRETVISIFSKNPIARANHRGYILR